MHTGKVLKKFIIVILVICEVLSGTSQIVFALRKSSLADDAIVIGFIDSGIAPYNMDETHILEGKNYVFENSDTVDRIGHGTKTAGTVLGSADGRVQGSCPNAYVVPLVVVDKYPSGVTENGGTSALISAIYDAVDVFGCRIINISLCTTENSEALEKAVDYAYSKGVIIVCAAGNNGENGTVCYPAHYDNVLTIGSSSGTSVADFSQMTDVDFYFEGKDLTLVSMKKGKTAADSGTSYSCAAVAGICAKLLTEDPVMSFEDVYAALADLCIAGTPDILFPGSHPFTDVKETDYFADAVLWAYKNGITNGTGPASFGPLNSCSRAEVCTFLWRVCGCPEPTGSGNPFVDVPEGSWYTKAVLWAVETGITNGAGSSDTFQPEISCSNAQIMTFIWRAVGCPDKTEDPSSWYSDAVNWAEARSMISGTYTGTYDVNADCPRCNVVEYLYRYINLR